MVTYEPFKTLPLVDFQEELRFEFPDLPRELFDYHMLKAARFMAKKGNLIRRTAIIEAQHCVTRYRLESPDGMEICSIMDIRAASHCHCGNFAVTRSFAPPEGAYSCRKEHAWFDPQDEVLHVSPHACHGFYFVHMAVAPTLKTCELPEPFYTDFLETLMLGTRANIMMVTGRAWSNLQLGQTYYNEFLDRINGNAIEVLTHKMRGAVKMEFGRVM